MMVGEEEEWDAAPRRLHSVVAGSPKRGGMASESRRDRAKQLLTEPAVEEMVLSFGSTLGTLRAAANATAALGLGGLALAVGAREAEYVGRSGLADALRVLVTLTTAGALLQLRRYYAAQWAFEGIGRRFLSSSPVWTWSFLGSFAAEAAVIAVHEPPFSRSTVDMATGYSAEVRVRAPWELFMLVRAYLVFRVLLHGFYTGGARLLGVWSNFRFSVSFVVRHVLYERPFSALVPAMSYLALACSYVFLVCEREMGDDGFPVDFGTSLYFTLVTVSALGYGDVYPLTVGGRFAAVTASLLANVLVAVLVAIIYQSLHLMPYESRMVIFLQRVGSLRSLRENAALVIQRRWRLHRAAQKGASRITLLRLRAHSVQALFDFHLRRGKHRGHSSSLDSSQLFRTMLEGIEADMRELKASGAAAGGAPHQEVLDGVTAIAAQLEQLSVVMQQQQQQQQRYMPPSPAPAQQRGGAGRQLYNNSRRKSVSRVSISDMDHQRAGGGADDAARVRARLDEEVGVVNDRMDSLEDGVRELLREVRRRGERAAGGDPRAVPLTPSPPQHGARDLAAELRSHDELSGGGGGGAGRLRPL